MAKCSVVGCEQKAVGGFKELISASSYDDPSASIEGMRTLWCKEDEALLRPTIAGKRGKFLTASQLAD